MKRIWLFVAVALGMLGFFVGCTPGPGGFPVSTFPSVSATASATPDPSPPTPSPRPPTVAALPFPEATVEPTPDEVIVPTQTPPEASATVTPARPTSSTRGTALAQGLRTVTPAVLWENGTPDVSTPAPILSLTPTPEPPAGTGSSATPAVPKVGRGFPFFAIQMNSVAPENGLAEAQAAGVPGLRHGTVKWREVEPVRTEPPTYLWEVLGNLDQQLIDAARAGMEVSLLVQATPDWAQARPGYICGPILEDRLDEFAQFLTALVQRYTQPPYDVSFWELFNEPDVDPSLVAPTAGFGCWGDQGDPYYGGAAFARMLRSAYPAVKAADPGAQVILGGLLMDAPYPPTSTFLAGVLRAGGGDFFDILAFHSYAFYHPDLYNWQTLPETKWIEWGGVMTGKVKFLRQILKEAGVAKPLILNEAGLAWWPKTEPSADYRQGQADYVVKLYTRGAALDLMSVTWYGWQGPGWRYMALLGQDLSPTPAYHALGVLIDRLGGSEYLGPTIHSGLEGYRFETGRIRLQVVWSADGQTHPATVPAGKFVAAYDLYGQPVSYDTSAGTVSISVRRPTYVERLP